MTTPPLYLLDTNVLLLLVRGKEAGKKIENQFGLSKAPVRPLISVVTIGEIRVLTEWFGWGRPNKDRLENALRNVVPVDINKPAVLSAYVEIDLLSQRHPDGSRNMGKNDLWIAACAKAANAQLLTTDKDFDHLIPSYLDGVRIDVSISEEANGD